METVHILGLVEGATGATIFITVAGPGHYSFSHSYTGSFDLPLPVQPGRFDIVVSADTDGTFTIDIQGTLKSVKPDVPFKFATKRKAFTLMV